MTDNQRQAARRKKIERLIQQWTQSVQIAVSGSRKDKGLGQIEVAEMMGWSRDKLGNIEQGRTAISVAELIVLSKEMGVDPEVMFRRVLKW